MGYKPHQIIMKQAALAPTATLATAKVTVEYNRQTKQITACDLVDKNNEPACFTKSKRGLEPVWAALTVLHASLGDMMTHRDVMNTFSYHNIKYHYWCRMD